MAKELNSKFDLSVTAYDEMFMTEDQRAENQLPKIHKIPITQISDFPDHPYRVLDDKNMNILKESIQERGLITPVTVRQVGFDQYEMISGHHRKRACELLGMDSIDAKVIECSRDEAIVLMVDSNSQRSQMFPTDKGKAYKMKYDAITRQGARTDIEDTSRPVGAKSRDNRSNEQLADASEHSARQIQRYIRLTYLTEEIQEYVDLGQMKMRPAVELSYCSEETHATSLTASLNPKHSHLTIKQSASERPMNKAMPPMNVSRTSWTSRNPIRSPNSNSATTDSILLFLRSLRSRSRRILFLRNWRPYRRLLQKQREGSR